MMQIFPDCGCGCKGKEQAKKFMRALIVGVLFFIVANPETFVLMRKVFGYKIASITGYPTTLGLLLHALVIFLISWGLMNIPGREKMTAPDWSKQKSNVSPDNVPLTNWSPTDSTGGAPPAPSSAPPVEIPKTLPAEPEREQPWMDTSKNDSWNTMGGKLGGLDINAPTPMVAATSGGSWQTCACPSGKQVMVMN